MGIIAPLAPERIEELLATSLIGRIACATPEGRPYLVPMGYGYDGDAIYAIGFPGRKIALMRAQPLVVFEVDRGSAEDEWESVVAEGTFEELPGEDGWETALRVLHGDGPYPERTEGAVPFRIVLTKKTGRFEIPDSRP
jgi:nitroimidazol reductase NimA-like FMN-containing flavoprotein (pyridoxamine 5'-phosphate oxidase superfamily)